VWEGGCRRGHPALVDLSSCTHTLRVGGWAKGHWAFQHPAPWRQSLATRPGWSWGQPPTRHRTPYLQGLEDMGGCGREEVWGRGPGEAGSWRSGE
jgi:hypothetical protein